MNGLKGSMNNNKTKHSRTRYNLKVEHIFERANSKVNLVTMLSGKTFYTDEKTSLLHAAEREGISLPYSCRNGRCSSCKCRISGPTIINFDELGLSDVEKKNGWKLACARSAIGDISLDIADLGNVNLLFGYSPRLISILLFFIIITNQLLIKLYINVQQTFP